MEGTPRGVHIEYDMLQSGRDTVVWSKTSKHTPFNFHHFSSHIYKMKYHALYLIMKNKKENNNSLVLIFKVKILICDTEYLCNFVICK